MRAYSTGMTHEELEQGAVLNLDFTKLRKVANCGADVLPAIAQDAKTGEVLIVGYANELALQTALECGMATFWSTSRNELWVKGKTSGDYLKIEDAPDLVKDTRSGAILNTNVRALEAYRKKREKSDKVDKLETRVVSLEQTINELKSLIIAVLAEKK